MCDDKLKFDVQAPCLRNIDMGEDAKCKRFLEIVFVETILPLIQGGHAKLMTVEWVCERLVDRVTQDIMMDIEHDVAVESLSEVDAMLKGILGLSTNNLARMLDHQSSIDHLRKHTGTIDAKDPAKVLANGRSAPKTMDNCPRKKDSILSFIDT